MKQIFRTIRGHVLMGGVLITPLAVTLWVILTLVNLLSNSRFSRWLSTPVLRWLPGSEYDSFQGLVSLLTVLALLFFTGLVFRNFLGRRAYRLLDRILENTPLINKIYTFVRTVSESLLAQKETLFREVVLVEYPQPNCYAVAFVSADTPDLILHSLPEGAEPHVFVFLPTTPNPTSGFMLMLPRRKVIPLQISSADAMRLIVSAGASTPSTLAGVRHRSSLLEKLDHMVLSQRGPGKPRPEALPNLNFPEAEDED